MKTRNFIFTAVLISCLTSFAGPGQIGSSDEVKAGTPDVFIGTLKQGGDESCPLIIVENISQTCAKFGFVNLTLQNAVMSAIKADSAIVKLSGKWTTRETGEGRKATLFVIEFVTNE